jgi:hypothetical protein
MFLTNWLILQIVAAGVTGAVEYPSAADFFMNFDSNNRLYFTGGSKGYVSNLILYKGETEYPVYNGSVSNIYISDPETYVSYIQLCNETYVTNTVDVQTVVNPEGAFPDTATNIIPGYATSSSWSQGSMGSYVDFNGDGTRMVVGMGLYNTNQGRAAVYHLEDGTWVQKVDLAPTSTSTRFGDSVLMNEDGTRIAVNYYKINTIKIYEYTNGAWPTTPTTSISGNFSDGDMDWNADGTVLGVAGRAYQNAYIYTRDSGTGTWSLTKTWSNSLGTENSIAINGAGTRIIVGCSRSGGSTNNWVSSIYEANYDSGTSTWSSLTEVGTYSHTGNTTWPARLRMNNDGTRLVAIGQATDASDTNIWHRQSGTSWTKTFDIPGMCSIYSRGSGSISYDGTMVLTGDYFYTDSVTSQGRAYLYEYVNGSWSLTKTYENPKTTPVASDGWGYGTAITKLKDRIAIGMAGDDTAGTDYGSLYVYDLEYSYPTLTQDNYNKLTLNSLNDIQSSRLTLNSNTYTANGPVSKFFVNEAGTYEVSAAGSNAYAIVKKTVAAPITLTEADIAWKDYTQADTTEQKIQATDAASQDYFGWSASISGDYAIVGAQYKNIGIGAAYIYTRNGTSWGSEQKITATDAASQDEFGWSVSISGDYAIVGATKKNSATGAAYIYTRSGTIWGSEQKLQATDAASQDKFGWSVSISGDYAIVGALNDDSEKGAAYIYTRDPSTGVWGGEQKITAGVRQNSDQFGYSVSIDGDYAIVGARYEDEGAVDAGAAYIYKRDASTGVWGSEQKLHATDAASQDQFGYSVSIDGDYAIVGTPYEDTGFTNAGAAYIYKRNPSTGVWGNEQKIQASDKQTQDYFGESVSISGDYAIVGARNEDPGGTTNAGSAYIFKRDGTTWSEIKKIQASDRDASDEFGYSVSISGDYAIVGARQENSSAGAAYIYKAPVVPSPKLTYDTYNKLTLSNVSTSYSSTLRYESNTYDIGSASTIIIQDPGRYEIATTDNENFMSLNSNVTGQTVTQVGVYDYTQMDTTEQKIQAGDKQTQDQFGWPVSISGDYAIVGAHNKDTSKGAAYIYTRSGTTWGNEQKIQASDGSGAVPNVTVGDKFGQSISLSGDYAIVGAPTDTINHTYNGSAYVYTRDPSTGQWGGVQKLTAYDKAQNDRFGSSVSISGDYAFVGNLQINRNDSSGSVYIFTRNGTTWGYDQKIQANDKAQGDNFGRSVSISGDYAIVGASSKDTSKGAAYIYTRSGTTWTQQANFAGEATQDNFGISVSISGDYAIVGAYLEDTGAADAGAAYIYTRDPSTGVWGNEQKIQASDKAQNDRFGHSVSISGDYAIVGALLEDPDGIGDAGAAYVFKREGTTWSEIKKIIASDKESSDYFGYSVAIDGTHAIVGARDEDPGGTTDAGAAYIYEAPNLASTLAYDGLNTLVLSNVSTGSYNTFLEGSNVLACATDLTTYPVPKSGVTGTFTYSARTKSDSAFAFTNDVSITDYYKTYQYPPIDGTTSGLTTSTTADTWNTWTISGAANGNGTYRAKWSVATGDGTPYNTFRNNVGSTNQVQTALNPTYPIDITLELPSAKTVRKYRMFPLDHVNPYGPGTDATSGTSVDPTLPGNGGDDATKRPKSWILYGYRTDPENPGWESLDTVTDKPISIYGDIYSIDTPGSYQQYKLSVTANNGGDKLLFGDIQLWGDA